MAKLSLTDFEKHQSATLVEQASDWVHSGRVSGLQEVERHFWVAKVQDEEMVYETEVILTPSKISAFACECWSSPRKRMCVHIIAALLLIRRFLQQKTLEEWKKNQEKKQEPVGLAKIQLQSILERVDPLQLQGFIREYARKNPDFGIAIKTRFADVVDDHPNAFLGLIKGLLPKFYGPLKPSQYKLLIRTINELSIRMEEAKSTNDFATGYKIASALVSTLVPWIAILEDPARMQLISYSKSAFNLLEFLRAQPLFSPMLKEAIWNGLLELIREHPLPRELRRPFLVPLSDWIKMEPNRQKELPDWSKNAQPAQDSICLLHLFVAAQKKDQARVKVLSKLLADNKTVGPLSGQEAVLELYHAGFLEAAGWLATALSNTGLSAGQTAEFRRIRMSIAEKTGDIQEQIRLMEPTFLASGSPELLNQIKVRAGEDWPNVLNRLLELAEADENSARVCQLLDYSGQAEALEKWHKKQLHLEDLQTYFSCLSDAQLATCAFPLLTEHLDTHFGRPSAVFVRDALGNWLSQGRRNMVRQLIQQLVREYPDRTGLKETLEELFAIGFAIGVVK